MKSVNFSLTVYEGEAGIVSVRAMHFEEKEANAIKLRNIESWMIMTETTRDISDKF